MPNLPDFISNLTFKPFAFDSNLDPFDDSSDDTSVTNSNIIPCQYYSIDNINTHFRDIGKCNLSLFHHNARSLNKHNNDILNYFSSLDHHFDIYGFSETWFGSDDDASLVDIGDYSVENCIREGRTGGGVTLFINNTINYRIRHDLSLDCQHCDSLFIETSNNSITTIIGIVYKPEYVVFADFISQLTNVLSTISNEKKSCYIMGDFNLDLLKHDSNSKILDFLNTFYSHDFIPSIDRPTRIFTNTAGVTSATLIDNIFTNDITANIISGVAVTDLSDHFPIFVTKRHSRPNSLNPNSLPKKCRQFKPNNIKGLTNALSLVDWNFVISTLDPDEAYNKFNDKLTKLLDIHCPLKTKCTSKRSTPKKPWITKGLIKSIKTKDKLYRMYISKPTPGNKLKYTKYRNYLNLLLRLSKKSHITNNIETNKNNTRKMWQTLNNLLGRNKNSKFPDFFTNSDGHKISNNNDIAEKFNSFFTNIGSTLAAKIPDPPSDFKPPLALFNNQHSLFLTPTSCIEIDEITSKLKLSNSSGDDNISNTLLKKIMPSINLPLVHIFNLSLSNGVVPTKLKIAHVTPIFKAGSKHDFTNYRPISILPSISKILEKIMYTRIFNFISKHNILSPNQFGFRPKRSTYMATNELYCKIAQNLDNNLHTVGIFLDLSKAFDTINHNILLRKLNQYGIRGLANDWIKNYLSGRQQRVTFNNTLSNATNISCGVPQGSILGPLLFLLYINDLPLCSKIPHFVLFADDTNILFSHRDPKTLETIINNELKHISNWFKLNKLSLNIKKTNFMSFKNKYSNKPDTTFEVQIDGIKITQVNTTKFLGLLIDHNLSWTSHTQHVSKIVSKYNGIIRKVRPFLPSNLLTTLYNSLVLPYLSYGTVVWADMNNANLNSLFLLQKRIIRTCTNSLWLDHTDPLFISLKTLKISDIYKLQLATFMFQYHHNQLPTHLIEPDFFNTDNLSHDYNTRHARDIFIKNTRTVLAKNTSMTQGPMLWNSLSTLLKNSPSLASFKFQMKKSLTEQYNPTPSP